MIGTRRVRPGYWFRPKRYGLGVVPASWQGWLATLAFLAAAWLIANVATHRDRMWFALLVPVTIAFLWLTATKTDGDWRFRWGEDA